MQIFTREIREDPQERQKRNNEVFYLDQQYFSKKCGEDMIRRNSDNMLVKNIFFREDGVVESAYRDETFMDLDSLNSFLKNHTIDEIQELNLNARCPSEEL